MSTLIQLEAPQAQQPTQSQHTRSSTQPSAAQRAFENTITRGPEDPGAPRGVTKKKSVLLGRTFRTTRPPGTNAILAAAFANLQLR